MAESYLVLGTLVAEDVATRSAMDRGKTRYVSYKMTSESGQPRYRGQKAGSKRVHYSRLH